MEHLFDGERCTFCMVNIYDDMLYGPDEPNCQREPIAYTTESDPSAS